MMQKFGRYQVVEWLGGGGMADVYVAEDPRLGRKVAIKVIRTNLRKQARAEFRRRFYREAKVMAKLNHRAIVPLYDFGEEAGRPFIVMRLMEGGSLDELLQQKGRFSLAEAVSLLERLAPAVDLAHQMDLVHRDLKPENILLDRDHNPYIADFGLVKLLTATVPSKTGSIGTAKYMSPEQALGDKTLDHRTDIYALGVILFELLTGQPPYDAPHPAGLAIKHINYPIPNICDLNSKLPATCQPVIECVLAKKPAERYATVADFADALKKLLVPATPSTVLVPEPVEGAVDLFMRGIQFYRKKEYQEAIAQFDQALRQNSAYVQAYFSRGQAYYQLAEYALAIADYDNTLRVEPKYTAAYYWRGRAKQQTNQFADAIRDYGDALRLNPNYYNALLGCAAAYFQRGQAQQAAGQLELALRDYDATLRLNPKHTQAQNARNQVQQELEAARKQEEERKRKEEEARKREQERKRKEEEARKREEERKRKQEEARKREQERKRKEEEARKREQERKRKQEEERKRQEAVRLREEERKRQQEAARIQGLLNDETGLAKLLNDEAALNKLPKTEKIQAYVSLFKNDALQQAIPAKQRAAIGVELAKLGDPRPEVMTIDGMEFCYVPPGPFWMGSDEGEDNAKPLHKVDIPYGYWIGRYPVTNAQYKAFMDDNGYRNPAFWAEAKEAGIWKAGQVQGRYESKPRTEPWLWHSSPYNLPNHPVVGIMWYEALAFTRWLSPQTGGPARLPSEAEWEKAARGGLEIPVTPLIRPASQLIKALSSIRLANNPSPQRSYPWGKEFDSNLTNSEESGIKKPNAVGLYGIAKSPYGAEEMSGNVWEWVQSQYKSYPYRPDDGRKNLQRDKSYYNLTFRGEFNYEKSVCIRCFFRSGDAPLFWYHLGFRAFRPPITLISGPSVLCPLILCSLRSILLRAGVGLLACRRYRTRIKRINGCPVRPQGILRCWGSDVMGQGEGGRWCGGGVGVVGAMWARRGWGDGMAMMRAMMGEASGRSF